MMKHVPWLWPQRSLKRQINPLLESRLTLIAVSWGKRRDSFGRQINESWHYGINKAREHEIFTWGIFRSFYLGSIPLPSPPLQFFGLCHLKAIEWMSVLRASIRSDRDYKKLANHWKKLSLPHSILSWGWWWWWWWTRCKIDMGQTLSLDMN